MSENNAQEFHDPLSQREQEVLSLLAQKLSDREIADRLYLSYTTIKWYNRQIFNKLGVDNRKKAVERAARLGLFVLGSTPELVKHNLPAQITPFVGRMSELENLGRLIHQPLTRLITVIAPGGMGKTRLALAAAEAAMQRFTDGIYFVPLASLTLSEHIMPLIATSVGFQLTPDVRPPKQQLLDFFRNKQLLLILDNFEHLLDSASLVDEILQNASQTKIVVTSRERLNLNGETVFMLGGLDFPESTGEEDALKFTAVQLFLQCALRAQPNFIIHDEKSAIRICQLVQGMPLALELAAAWISTLSLADIVTEITRSIDFLSTSMRNVPPRLKSIRAVFDTTWGRLTEGERHVFSKISVFRGGCTREAAETVAGANPYLLSSLVSKALLWHHAEAGRYEIHELMRQYAQEQLESTGETGFTLSRHREYFGQYAGRWASALKTPDQLNALDKLEADFENIREAFSRAIETGQPDMVEPFTHLWNFFEIRGHYTEGIRLFEAAIEKLNHSESIALGRLLAGQGLFFERNRMFEKSLMLAERSVVMLRHLDAIYELPMPLMILSSAQGRLDGIERSSQTIDEALEIAYQYNDQWAVSLLLFLAGTKARQRKEFDHAKRLITEASVLVKRLNNIWALGFMLVHLSDFAIDTGDYEEAKALLEEAIAGARLLHHLIIILDGLRGLCMIAILQGDFQLAKHLTEDALKIAHDAGNRAAIFEDTITLAEIALALNDIPEANRNLREALNTTSDVGNLVCLLLLPVAAGLCQQRGMIELSIEILSFIEQQSKYEDMFESITLNWKTLLLKGRTMLPSETYRMSYERGQMHTLEMLLATLLIQI